MAESQPPKYHVHRAKNRAFAYFTDEGGVRRRRYFPGKPHSPESVRAFAEFLRAWQDGDAAPREPRVTRAANSSMFDDLTVGEIAAAYLRHADDYYVKNGEPTSEASAMRRAIEPVVTMFGDVPAREFSVRRLRAVRDSEERSGRLCRREVNRRVDRIRRVFRWAESEELVPPGTTYGLRSLPPLQHGRSIAAEVAPVEPVDDEHFEAALAVMTPTVRAMCLFLRYTGARPQEVCSLRWEFVDRASHDGVWLYRCPDHKNFHRGHERVIGIGSRAQEALRPYMCVQEHLPVFSPERSQAERRALQRQGRASPLTPSQRARDQRRADDPARDYSASWKVAALGRSVAHACRQAGVPRWTPLQLRHRFEAEAESRFGLEVASRALGHSTLATTEHYRSKRKSAEAVRVARQLG